MCEALSQTHSLTCIMNTIGIKECVTNGNIFFSSQKIAPLHLIPVIHNNVLKLLTWGYKKDENSTIMSILDEKSIDGERCEIIVDGFFIMNKHKRALYCQRKDKNFLYIASIKKDNYVLPIIIDSDRYLMYPSLTAPLLVSKLTIDSMESDEDISTELEFNNVSTIALKSSYIGKLCTKPLIPFYLTFKCREMARKISKKHIICTEFTD